MGMQSVDQFASCRTGRKWKWGWVNYESFRALLIAARLSLNGARGGWLVPAVLMWVLIVSGRVATEYQEHLSPGSV